MSNLSEPVQQWKAKGQEINTPWGDQFVYSQGSGEPIVFLHGFPTCGWDWHALVPQLSGNFHCIVPDLLGFGFSEPPSNNDYATAQQVKCLQYTLKQLNISDCHIIAFSYGSSVAQEWLNQLRDDSDNITKIKSICFLNGGLFPETNRPRRIQKLLLSPLGGIITKFVGKASLSKNLQALFSNTHPISPELLDQYWQYITCKKATRRLHHQIGYLRERQTLAMPWQNALLQADIPIQLQFGREDHLSGPDVVEQFKYLKQQQSGSENIKSNVVIQLYQEVGHYPQLEIPETVAKHYLSFVNQKVLNERPTEQHDF